MQFYNLTPRLLLIESLCRAMPAVPAFHVFAGQRHSLNFHCTSFFRTEQVVQKEYNAWQPFSFKDGRVYEVLDIKLVCGQSGGVARRCCVDVIERTSSEFLPFEVWFYESAMEEGRFQESYEQGMIRATRQWIWEFLFEKRNAVDWSRNGMPYVCECR